jgi:hypothetical protein
VSSHNYTPRSKAPFSGLGERLMGCEDGAYGRDRPDGVSTGKSLMVILKSRHHLPTLGQMAAVPSRGSKIVRLRHLAPGSGV